MKTQGHITYRSLPLLGQCAFVCAALEGSSFGQKHQATSGTMHERHFVVNLRPIASLGDEDGIHPGKGGA